MSTRDDIVNYLRFMPQGTDQWKQLTKGVDRVFEITASVAPNIVGVGYSISPFKQWQYDSGAVVKPPENPITAQLLAKGTEDEDAVVQLFVNWWNENLQRPLLVYRTGTWQHPTHDWLAASPDRYLYDVEHQTVYLLEAKSRQDDRDAMQPSDTHYVQCQLQLACIPEAKGLFYISANVRSTIVDLPTMICAIKRDDAFLHAEIYPKLLLHRQRVADKVPPPTRQPHKPNFGPYIAAAVSRVYPPADS